jgi:dCMP deaminase
LRSSFQSGQKTHELKAEINTLLSAGSRAKGGTLFVWGKPVCARCAASMIQAGILKVVAIDPNNESDKSSDWYKLGILTEKMFNETERIEIKYYDSGVIKNG